MKKLSAFFWVSWGCEIENGILFLFLWLSIKVGWEINVVKLKYPLKHYCKQFCCNRHLKKIWHEEVNAHVFRLWKWNELEKRKRVCSMLDMYLNILLICASHEESENFTCCRFFPLFTSDSIFGWKNVFPLE